jgi:four helix bundle protein
MIQFRFEKLEAWQLAIEFCDSVYVATKRFPEDERYGLTSQLRRAAVSIPANIAEGSGRTSDKDNLRFVDVTYGSLMEVVSHVEVAHRQVYIRPDQREKIREQADRQARVLSGLRNYLLGNSSNS